MITEVKKNILKLSVIKCELILEVTFTLYTEYTLLQNLFLLGSGPLRRRGRRKGFEMFWETRDRGNIYTPIRILFQIGKKKTA